MALHHPDTSSSPAVFKVLQKTRILRPQAPLGFSAVNKTPAERRTTPPITKSLDLLAQDLTKTEAISPILSYEKELNCLVPQNNNRPAIASTPRSVNNAIVYPNGYVVFPPYHKAPDHKTPIIKKCANKIKACLRATSDKWVSGLEAVCNFYACSEQKWESEYQPFERVTSNLSTWETVDAADRRERKSWTKKLQKYWRPESVALSGPSNDDGRNVKINEAGVPRISNQPKEQNHRNSEQLQTSRRSLIPLKRGRKIEQRRSERICLSRQPAFSQPKGRMQRLERQHSLPCYGQRQQQQQTQGESLNIQQQQQHEAREIITSEDEEEEQEQEQGGKEGLDTPWSGLKTVPEEDFFGDWCWMQRAGRLDHEGIGHRHAEREGTGLGVDERGESDCDGFEVSGELCLRHESCLQEAIALGRL